MSLLVPDVGEVELLKRLLVGRSALITGATNASPIVLTSNSHGLSVNDRIVVADVGGNTAANGTFVISAVAANTITLTGTTGNGAYTSGGSWTLADIENGTLKLRSDGVTPAEGDTAGTYTEATFTGYSTKTLTSTQTSTTWAVPTTATGTTSSTYGGGTPLSYTPTSSQTITGYFVVGATTGTLWWSENFASSKALSNGDTFQLSARLALD